MNKRDCVVCESGAHAEYYCSVDAADYLLCRACGLIYVDEPERSENIYKAYTGGFWKVLRRKLMAPMREFPHTRNFTESMERAAKIFRFSSAQVSLHDRQGIYLDIGCNKGFLLAIAADQGWNVYGEELVPELTAPFCKTYQQFSHQVFNGRFQDMQQRLQSGMFDLVTAIDVIEHFEDPVRDLTDIFRILRPGGVLVVQTPDTDSHQARKLKGEWGALKPLEHLHLFNAGNLATFANRIGFSNYRVAEPFEEADGNFVAIMARPD